MDAFTPHEPWSVCREEHPRHWYAAQADFVVPALGPGGGRSCLVIGSPVFEALAIEAEGWEVTYLDIRQPPPLIRNWQRGDACDMPFADDSFDAVSSTCVLCHAGLGRYGDVLRVGGDIAMLLGIERVLRPGGTAVVMAGPCAESGAVRTLGSLHRVYTSRGLSEMVRDAGLTLAGFHLWAMSSQCWRDESDIGSTNPNSPDYATLVMRKP